MKRTLLANVIASLFIYEGIRTTLAKAKRAKPIAEHLIRLAQRGDVQARREVLQVVPRPHAVARLFSVIAPRMANRPGSGGCLRLVRVGWRKGDGAPVAILELVDRKLRPKKQKKAKQKDAALEKSAEAAPA